MWLENCDNAHDRVADRIVLCVLAHPFVWALCWVISHQFWIDFCYVVFMFMSGYVCASAAIFVAVFDCAYLGLEALYVLSKKINLTFSHDPPSACD